MSDVDTELRELAKSDLSKRNKISMTLCLGRILRSLLEFRADLIVEDEGIVKKRLTPSRQAAKPHKGSSENYRGRTLARDTFALTAPGTPMTVATIVPP